MVTFATHTRSAASATTSIPTSFVRIASERSATASATASAASASDAELLLAYRERGDRDAFETLVHRYEGELSGYLYHTLGDHTLADDAFQRAFLKVHLHCDRFDANRPFRAWLYQIARNTARDIVRYNRRLRRRSAISLDTPLKNSDNSDALGLSFAQFIEGREGDPAEHVLSNEMVFKARAALEKLSETHRQTILLTYFQGMTYREAAATMGTNLETVKSRLATAIQRLGEILTAPTTAKIPHDRNAA